VRALAHGQHLAFLRRISGVSSEHIATDGGIAASVRAMEPCFTRDDIRGLRAHFSPIVFENSADEKRFTLGFAPVYLIAVSNDVALPMRTVVEVEVAPRDDAAVWSVGAIRRYRSPLRLSTCALGVDVLKRVLIFSSEILREKVRLTSGEIRSEKEKEKHGLSWEFLGLVEKCRSSGDVPAAGVNFQDISS
jgi:hypothetical protein